MYFDLVAEVFTGVAILANVVTEPTFREPEEVTALFHAIEMPNLVCDTMNHDD